MAWSLVFLPHHFPMLCAVLYIAVTDTFFVVVTCKVRLLKPVSWLRALHAIVIGVCLFLE